MKNSVKNLNQFKSYSAFVEKKSKNPKNVYLVSRKAQNIKQIFFLCNFSFKTFFLNFCIYLLKESIVQDEFKAKRLQRDHLVHGGTLLQAFQKRRHIGHPKILP